MKRLCCVLTCIMTCGTAVAVIPVVTHAEEAIQRTVKGAVVATNVDADPQTIVVTVSLPNKEELVVGARVPPDTKITRGKRAARLVDVKAGEKVELLYLKTSDGLVARSIHVR